MEDKFTSSTGRNNIITWVDVAFDGTTVGSVQLPPFLTDKQLRHVEVQTLSFYKSAFRHGELVGKRAVQSAIRKALDI